MKRELAVIKEIRKRRLELRKASSRLSETVNHVENKNVLSDMLCAFAGEMDKMLEHLEKIYESSYLQTQNDRILARTILDLPEVRNDKKLRQKIFLEFRKAELHTSRDNHE